MKKNYSCCSCSSFLNDFSGTDLFGYFDKNAYICGRYFFLKNY